MRPPHLLHLPNALARAALSALLATLLVATPALAQGGMAFSLRPDPDVTRSTNAGYFVYDLPPGTVVEDAVLVVNNGGEPLDLVLYAADGVTADNGGVAFPTNFGQAPTRTGAWLNLSETELTLQPGESRSVPFTFTIPADVAGERAAGIIAQPADAPTSEGQFAVTVVQRSAVTVLVTVQSDVPLQPRLEITALTTEISGDQQLVVVELRNTGDVGLRPEGNLIIRDADGNVIREVPIQLGYFLAGDVLNYRIALDPPLPTDEYEVGLSLDSEAEVAEGAARLSLPEPGTPVPVVEFDGQAVTVPPAQPAGETGVPVLWVVLGGGLILLLVGLLLFQTMRLSRARRREG